MGGGGGGGRAKRVCVWGWGGGAMPVCVCWGAGAIVFPCIYSLIYSLMMYSGNWDTPTDVRVCLCRVYTIAAGNLLATCCWQPSCGCTAQCTSSSNWAIRVHMSMGASQ